MPNADELKGWAKEAAGGLTGNDHLKREGKVDRAAATVKDKLGAAREKTEHAVDEVKGRVEDVIRRH